MIHFNWPYATVFVIIDTNKKFTFIDALQELYKAINRSMRVYKIWKQIQDKQFCIHNKTVITRM